jgi:hypothetical protein
MKDSDIYMSYLTQILAVGNLFNHRHTFTPLQTICLQRFEAEPG